jgi:beta-phosphoglucomutase-like phosphatase (HAD superfamily)
MMIDTLIFDMDGTMIDSMPFHALSWQEFVKKHALPVSPAQLMARTTGRTGHECMEILFERTLSREEGLALVKEKEDIYRALFAPQFREVAGFSRFAQEAYAQGFKLGIGTAGDQANIAFALGHLKLAKVPDVIVGGDQGFAGKPNPDIFLEVARQLTSESKHCLVFEDAPFGIEAAARAGMQAVAITSSHEAHELAGPHVQAIAPNFIELLDTGFLRKLHLSAPI